ncbi:hypothetical protein KC992_00915 [Candidatus Saccharibacteria bacterium]|nr:hypothetical protein [Candidatus Saccharibacteria bacterium]
MSLGTLERGFLGAGIAAGAVVSGYNVWAEAYRRDRQARLPEGGTTQSTLPFYEAFGDIATRHGVECTAVGGVPKQALRDPEVEFDVRNRQFYISNPVGHTLGRATLYRPTEHNIRDDDRRAKRILRNGEWVVADASFTREETKALRTAMQADLDEVAHELGFPRGPELSLFFYEPDFGPFRPWHYATRTQLVEDGAAEFLYASNGVTETVRVDKPWECIVDYQGREVVIPTDSPRTLLGRTLTRPVKARVRDLEDVQQGVDNITRKGLADELLGDTWAQYLRFRGELDRSLGLQASGEELRDGNLALGANLMIASALAPHAHRIEGMVIAEAIRDPETRIGQLAAKIMGAA